MSASGRDAVVSALSHRAAGRIPVDFGSTSVTGIHVSCVAALRERYGLERRPVKVHEPYQMLGLLEDDLQRAMGIDVEGVFPRNTMFGFPIEDWKPWTFRGIEVLVPADFNTTAGQNGDTLIYPKGDTSVAPSGRMPKDGFFFDSIVRQKPIDEDRLDPADNLEEFTAIAEEDLAWFARSARDARATGRAVIANFGGTAFGDVALVRRPFSRTRKESATWPSGTCRRAAGGSISTRFSRVSARSPSETWEKIRVAVGGCVDAVFTCGTDFGTQTSAFCSVPAFRELYFPYYQRLNEWIHRNTNWKTFKHSCGSVERFIDSFIECGFDILNPGCRLGRGHGPRPA